MMTHTMITEIDHGRQPQQVFSKKVSVVIPIVPRDPFVNDCVKSVEASSYKNIEVIIVNHKKERSHQRNVGIDCATGDYLLILDADQRVSPFLISECVRIMDKGASGVYIPERIITKGFFAKFRDWERQFYTGTAVDCVRFVNRSNLRFDETMSGPEDSDFDRRVLGFKAIATNPIYHDDRVGILEYFRKKAYYAKSMDAFIKKYPKDKCLNFWWRCFVVFIEDGKWKRLVKNPLFALILFLVIFIRGVIYVSRKSRDLCACS